MLLLNSPHPKRSCHLPRTPVPLQMRPDELKDMLASIGMDMLFAKELMVRLPAPFSFSIVRVVTSFVSLCAGNVCGGKS